MNNTDASAKGTAVRENSSSGVLTRGLVVVGTLLLCVGMLEAGLRLAGRYPGNSVEGFFAQGRSCYRLRSNFSQTLHWPAGSFTVNTDDMGFRFRRTGSRELQDRKYYAVLGSSEVFGHGLNYDDTFIGVLGQRLERDGIQVVNMAVGGHALDVQSDIFHEFAAAETNLPLNVLICLNPKVIDEYDDRHPNVVVRWGYLFGRTGWRTALAKHVLENTSTAYCFFRDALRNVQMRYLNAKDFDIEYYFEAYSTTSSIRSPQRSGEFLDHLKALEQFIRKLGATPVCVYCPTTGGFAMNKLKAEGKLDGKGLDTQFFPDLVEAHCRAEGVQFINTEPLLQKLFDEGKTLNIRLDGHFNAPTSLAMGDFLYESLKPAAAKARETAGGSTHPTEVTGGFKQ